VSLDYRLIRDGETRFLHAEGNVIRDESGLPRRMFGTVQDMTDLRRLEHQLRQAQKMEAVGQLAGGVAHDFNNLLTVINGYSDLILSRLGPDDPNRGLVAEIQRSGERAATLTGQLLAFSRKQLLQPVVVDLNVVLASVVTLLKRLIGEHIELVLVQAESLGRTKVDPAQFEQTIINLAVNARDAMPDGGRLTIETATVELDDDYVRLRPYVRPGSYVQVSVSDTGHGMDEAVRTRIFEPFFTTKPAGEGTGLGLAMVYGFVKQSGGHIEVYSEVGHGTSVKIYLPRTDDAPPLDAGPQAPARSVQGTETVLLVEDEDAVRTLAEVVLQSNGYAVLVARQGEEALEMAAAHRGPIHLLVTDLVMPHMGGRELAEQLAGTRPGLRVLFMSGYPDEASMQHGLPGAGAGFLQKPFSPIALARKVRDVLDAAGGT
jgi:two-component system cell cycle sensor histidine kinase/response regulator CckA